MVVPLSIVVLGILACAWYAVRNGAPRPERARPERSRFEIGVGAALVLLGNAPLLRVALESPPLLPGDMRSHANVARALAQHGIQDGWIDAYHAGFPYGPHYPPVPWLLAALLDDVGVAPGMSVHLLGFAAVLATIFAIYLGALKAGARWLPAVAGALAYGWIAPLSGFFGGWQAFGTTGAFAQLLVAPLVVVAAYSTACGRSHRAALLIGALLVATHPQVAACASLVLAPVAIAVRKGALRRWLILVLGEGLLGVGIYGMGLLTLHVPFGWPRLETWAVVGRPPQQMIRWFFEGELFDFGRPPLLTTVFIGASLVLLATARSRSSRAILLALAFAIAASLAGPYLLRLGRIGTGVISFFQPLRMLVVVSLAFSFAVIGATHQASRWVRFVLRSRGFVRAVAAPFVPCLVIAFVAPAGLRWQRQIELDRETRRATSCARFDVSAVSSWLSHLTEGRLIYDERAFYECAAASGFELESSVPIGWPHSVGAHVGVVADAYRHLDPYAPGAAGRAEALDVRYVLHPVAMTPLPVERWRTRERAGDVVLSELTEPGGVLGAGCVVASWSGPDGALRESALSAIEAHDGHVYDARRFTALDVSRSAPLRVEEEGGGCDEDRARVVDAHSGPGLVDGVVEVGTVADVVVRVTAYRTWRIDVDGVETPWREVLPGFPAVRVSPGRHRIRARTTWDLPWVSGVGLSMLAVAFLLRRLRRR